MTPLKLRYRRHFGHYTEKYKDSVVDEMNKLIDLYNDKINTFDTYEKQYKFLNQIEGSIDKLKYKL